MKCLAMAFALLAVGGCAYRDAVVLENGEKVNSLYYHESRMPDEVMVEIWIDFDARRFRFKCGQHDAMGWASCRFDGNRLDLVMEGREWGRLVNHVQKANVEAWPGVDEGLAASVVDAPTYYLRMQAGDKHIERFAVGKSPKGIGEIQSLIQFALSHKDLHLWPGEVASREQLAASAR